MRPMAIMVEKEWKMRKAAFLRPAKDCLVKILTPNEVTLRSLRVTLPIMKDDE